MDITTKEAHPTKKQMRLNMQQWMNWIYQISDIKQLAVGRNHFSQQVRVLKPNDELIETPQVAGSD